MKRSHWLLLAGLVVLTPGLGTPLTALGDPAPLSDRAPYPVPQLWAQVDGPDTPSHAWVWGPTLLAAAHEPFAGAPGGTRQVFYFDKGRLQIDDPGQDPTSPGYVGSGLLVRDLIAGEIQIGDDQYLTSTPANIPLTGDTVGNALAPTYAALNGVASIGDDLANRRSPQRVGQPVTALMHADGSIDPNAVPQSDVSLATYSNATGHNIAKPFADWLSGQAQSWELLTGYPLTEPYWSDTVIAGKTRRVLFQAFERRVLTYTPGNPAGWQVESNNAGQHYRSWHHLATPADQPASWLADGVPFGEVIVRSARADNLDPFLVAALAQVASNFDPAYGGPDGRAGLFGVRPQLLVGQATPLEPYVNAEAALRLLSDAHSHNSDWRAVLAIYYTGQAHPDWTQPGLNTFVDGVLREQATLLSQFSQPPPPPAGPPAIVHRAAAIGAFANLYLVDSGPAAYYSPNHTVAWWDYTVQRYKSWGQALPNAQPDPNGYYCVHPDFKVGDRLQLTANGVTLWCTIGDTVAAQDEASWRAHWAVELSWNTFVALGLPGNNQVEVRHP